MESSVYLILIIVAMVSILVGFLVGRFLTKKEVAQSEELANKVLNEAKKEAETIKKEATLESKAQMLKLQSDMDKKYRKKEDDFSRKENRLSQKEETLDRRSANLDKKEENIQRMEKEIKDKENVLNKNISKYENLVAEIKQALESVARMTEEEAREELKNQVIDEAKRDAAKKIKEIEEETRQEADKISKKIIAVAVQRYSGEYVSENTVSVVNLPNDDMKGRIIGREGRNIRSIEAATGVDVIIDDTPEAVIISGHDPVRREVARLSLEKLVADGRIHPARIEEVVNSSKKEIDKIILEMGQKAIFDLGIHKMHPELVKLIGRLKFRTSYAQNIFQHSMEVAFITGIMAAELGMNEKVAKRAGLLHDIGKAVDHEVEGPHAKIGADLAKKYGEKSEVLKAVGQHHDDSPETVLGVLVQAADALSAARPGARKEMLENYIRRMQDLENIATNFNGVQKAYAIQAGRELRVIVQSDRITDEDAVVLSLDISKEFEIKLNYPGQIKVTVIRETRAIAFAR